MTVTSGFFNSVNHDRLYDAEQVSSMFDGIITDGVYENYGEALNVKAYSGANSTVIVGTGRAWFDHTWTLNDSQFSIVLDPPNELLNRVDAIVIDVDKTQSVRKNSIIYVKGSESTPDSPPTLINTDLHKQYPICYINRPAGSNKPVTQSDITITVGTSVCPIVTGILEAQNLENLMQQLDDEFNTWWDGIKETLDDNVATKLQNQINEIKEQLNSDTALVGLLEKPIAEAFMSGDYNLNIESFSVSKIGAAGSNPIEFYNPLAAILPDGKILAVYVDKSNIQVVLANQDGVATSNDYNYAADYTQTSGLILASNYANCNLDVYPVTFNIIIVGSGSSSGFNTPQYAYSTYVNIKYTITSAGVVSHTIEGRYSTHEVAGVFQTWTKDSPTGLSRKLSSGSYIYSAITSTGVNGHLSDAIGNGFITSVKLTSDGVLGNVVSTNSDRYAIKTINPQGNIGVYENDGTIILFDMRNIGNVTNYDIIDENSLMVTYGGDNFGSSIPDYISNYNAETYTLSEKNGVVTSKVIIGSSRQYSDVKKSNYFCGASNSGEAIPEGTFVAKNIESRLYGVGPNGENIAIGTNGGAAILKGKTDLPASIDKQKIITEHVGYKTVDNKTIYLLDNNTHSATQTFSVVIIS